MHRLKERVADACNLGIIRVSILCVRVATRDVMMRKRVIEESRCIMNMKIISPLHDVGLKIKV